MPDEAKQNLVETDATVASPTVAMDTEAPFTAAFASTDRLIGSIFADKYDVQSRLGQGGMSIVYKAFDRLMNRAVALKILLPGRELDDRSIIRFQQEARANGSLDHAHIAKVYDFNVSKNGVPFLSMALVDGPTIAAILKKERIKPDQAITLAIQVCQGMQHAHEKGILHRDLKPSNILLAKLPSGEYSAQIADFGIAKLADNSGHPGLTQTGDIFGSPLYMSPEQALGETVDARSDIYAVGCMLYEMLTGAPPFTASTSLQTISMQISQLPPTLKQGSLGAEFSPNLEALVAKSLAKEKNERFQTMSEFETALTQLKSSNAVPTEGKQKQTKAKPRTQPNEIAFVGAVVLASLATVILISQIFMSDETPSQTAVVPAAKKNVTQLKSNEQEPPAMMLLGSSADQVFDDISVLKSGDDLSAEGLQVTDKGLASLAKAPDITSLNLSKTAVTDKGLKKLSVLKHLRELKLSCTLIKGNGLKALALLPDLRELSICDMPQLETGSFKNLSGIDLFVLKANSDKLKNQDIDDLTQLSHLTQLELFRNFQLTDEIVPMLCRLPELRTLKIANTRITDAGVKKLCKGLPRVEQLDLSGTKIGNASIGFLKGLKHLKVLEVTGTQVGMGSLKDLCEMKGLTSLAIDRRQFNDLAVRRLKSFLPACDIKI